MNKYTGKKLEGATVTALEYSFVIDKVLYAYKEREGYDIEFLDTNGDYHHWKQWYDGGEIKFPKKRLVHEQYNIDMTDLFQKYGYDV